MTKITRFKELVWQRHPLTGSTVFCDCLQIRFRELTWKAAACVLIHRRILSHWGNDHFHCICICKSDKNGRISYCRWWFHTASWASRPHTAKCWCTCGSGRCLSTCSRAPCAARIWTPPSPPAVYFRGRKEKQQAGGKRMSIHLSTSDRFSRLGCSDGATQRKDGQWVCDTTVHFPLSHRLLDIIQTGSGGNRQRCNRGRPGQGRPEGRAVFRPTHKSRYAAGICDKCA